MKIVLTLISDENYLEHAKSLFYSVRNMGKWKHDLCLIANNVPESRLEDFRKFGVQIFNINESNCFFANYHVFDKFFKNWEIVISMDCDFTIFKDLNDLIDESLISQEVLLADKEPFSIKSYFCWANINGELKNDISEGREMDLSILEKEFPINDYGFNAGLLIFNTNLIFENTLENLYKLSNDLKHINFHTSVHGSDQPILNLYFHKNIKFIENKKISYWRDSDLNTIAQHHCRWDAPWKNDSYSDNLGETYRSNYQKNLEQFYKITNNN